MPTHFVPYDAPRIGRRIRALCGELVDARDQAIAPTCPECVKRLREDVEALNALQTGGAA